MIEGETPDLLLLLWCRETDMGVGFGKVGTKNFDLPHTIIVLFIFVD